MQTSAGNSYQLGLALQNAEAVGPSWLAAAVMATYPSADLASVTSYDGKASTIVIRWRSGTGAIEVGDRLMVTAEGIQVPSGLLPMATVTSASEVTMLRHPADVVGDSVQQLDPEYNAALKLTTAAAILGLVAYFAGRIRRKHVDSRTP